MTAEERIYWIWLAETLGQGSIAAAMLIRQYGDARLVYETPAEELVFPANYAEENAARVKIKLKNRSLDQAQEILERCRRLEIDVIPYGEARYPMALAELPDLPLVLYMRGRMPNFRNYLAVTVVGTRGMTDYGRRMAYSLGAGLAFGGAVVVSGMALGTDSMALIGALDAGGVTAAVLGSGVDVIYPREHRELYYKILEHGAVISEYAPGTPPTGSHFPKRNRIMSGLSAATVVVEAGESSGSLITARDAVAQGRKLFAVPGKVGEANAVGTNALLQDGAVPAVCAEDVLSEFEFQYPDTIRLANAHARIHKLDLEELSKNAMNRSRISSGTGAGNYYGSGSYGGRERDVLREAKKKQDQQTSQPKENVRPSKRSEAAPEPAEQNSAAEIRETKAEAPKKSGVKEALRSVFDPLKGNKSGKTEKQTVNSEEKVIPAEKIELDMLDENEIRVYNKMKPNVPMLPDELVDSGDPVSSVLSALTMLEAAGAVESGSGGYFVRLTTDDIMQSPND